MPLCLKYTQPLAGVWKIDEDEETLLSQLSFTERYSPFLERVTNDNRRLEWLAARVLIKELLGEEPVVAYRPNGAPYFPDIDIHLSISHTKGYAAVALSSISPTGIDIEYRSDRILKVKGRFLSPVEEEFIDPDNEVEHTLVCWCAKEAVYKRIGNSNTDFREHIRIAPFQYKESGIIAVHYDGTYDNSGIETFNLNYLISRYFVLGWLLDSSAIS